MTKKARPSSALKGRTAENPSPEKGFKEETSMEKLAKEALEETIREGGAFASENPNQFEE